MNPHVTIVTLNWNSFSDTARSVDSVLNSSYENIHVYIIDNASTDGSKDKLNEKYGMSNNVTIIENDRNLGFSTACNIGIRKGIENNTEYILLLNNDTLVEKDFLNPLVSVMEEYQKVGLVGGIIKYMNKDEIWYAGGEIDRFRIQSPQQNYITNDEPYHTNFVTGALMLINTELIEDIGMLNEDYFFGMEDKEYSLRAKETGWKLMVAPESVIHHEKGGSTDDDESPFQNYHTIRNNIYFASNVLQNSIGLAAYFRLLAITILGIIRWSLIGERRQVKAAILAFSDYYMDISAVERGTFLLEKD
jgi:GT2 family glycosyltransferase